MTFRFVKNRKEFSKLLPGEKPVAVVRGGHHSDQFIILTPTLSKLGVKTISVEDGIIEPWPETDPSQRDVLLITSPSGCGKSYYAAMYANNFLDEFKKSRVLIVTPDNPEKDPAYDNIEHVWLPIEELADENGDLLTVEDIADEDGEPTLIIFDDVENLASKKLDDQLIRFASSMLQRARKDGVYIVFILHRAACGLLSRFVLQEQTAVVFSSVNCGSGNLEYALTKHMGFKKGITKMIDEMAEELGRMVYLKTNTAHRYLISDKKIALVGK